MLKGIDVSSWQGFPFTNASVEQAYNESDFIITKATQGTNYINPCCDDTVQRCIKDGKLWGFYHYAGNGNAINEAEYFVKHCKGYFGNGIPVLDFESYQNENNWNNDQWCRQFVEKVHELTDVWCVIYIQASAISKAANCSEDCGLWVAGYPINGYKDFTPPEFPYNVNPWEGFTIWQYTNNLYGAVDGNCARLTREAWGRIAKGNANQGKDTTDKKDGADWLTLAARDVMTGKYGNGEDRKNRLYNAIQKRVNELAK